jgi:hypothetical protein
MLRTDWWILIQLKLSLQVQFFRPDQAFEIVTEFDYVFCIDSVTQIEFDLWRKEKLII